ncbi:putative constitutive coactivator of PPAR-gamma-like protein [Sesbania bispinosa]|nr:putative constitutive coactivator of PPAR-gamma-like protein [Sesbania bispinosa]
MGSKEHDKRGLVGGSKLNECRVVMKKLIFDCKRYGARKLNEGPKLTIATAQWGP